MEYMYYGRNDVKKPKIGVAYMMLDEHLKSIIDKNVNNFDKKIKELFKQHKKDSELQIKRIKKHIVEIKKDLGELMEEKKPKIAKTENK